MHLHGRARRRRGRRRRGRRRPWRGRGVAPTADWGRPAGVEDAGAHFAIGSRLVTPSGAIFAAIAAICFESAATTAPWRGVWRRRRRRCGGAGCRNWLRWLRRWDCPALTAAQSTILQHITGVCLTLSIGGPICATRIVIGARADTAAQSTVLQHPDRVCLTFSIGGPICATRMVIGARSLHDALRLFEIPPQGLHRKQEIH